MADPLHHPIADVVIIRPAGVGLALLGGLIGSAIRGSVAFLIQTPVTSIPVATLAVNLAGSFLLGLFLGRHRVIEGSSWMLSFVAVGVLGSLTTFSAFSVEVVQLVDARAVGPAAIYVVVSVVGGLGAAWAGEAVGGNGR